MNTGGRRKKESVVYNSYVSLYSQREWDRTVGYGEVPEEYSRKAFEKRTSRTQSKQGEGDDTL